MTDNKRMIELIAENVLLKQVVVARDKQIKELKFEIENLKVALQQIIEECPNPKLPYGNKIVEIAKFALSHIRI